jgi:hypothetical protein
VTHSFVNHHITGHLVFVLASTERIILLPATDDTTSAVIHFVQAKNMMTPRIHLELCARGLRPKCND